MTALLLPLDRYGVRVVRGDIVKNAYDPGMGGRVEKTDGVMLTISIRFLQGKNLEIKQWVVSTSPAADWEVVR